MKNIHDTIEQLSSIQNRYRKFLKLFGEFKTGLEHIKTEQFPLKGVEIPEEGECFANLSFLDRNYQIRFGMTNIDGSQKGLLTFFRIEDDKSTEINRATYNGQGLIDVGSPQGEDELYMGEDNVPLLLVLNWVLDELTS